MVVRAMELDAMLERCQRLEKTGVEGPMPYTHAERLSALDVSFLELEEANAHMHIGAVAVFEAASVTRAEGGVDIELVRKLVEAGLHRIPRYRQRLARIPLLGHPVWVDDERFNLAYHVRHTRLPLPGDERQLKRLAGRIMSQALDRGKPLWEMWVTNVPGPAFPVYVLGARMVACHPLVPLYRNQALGIALFSYDGRLWWGFNADWDALPDLHDIVAAVEAEAGALARVAGIEVEADAPPRATGTG
jgi:hypothetical protein